MRTSGQAFQHSYIDVHKVRRVQFGILNPKEVKEMSVVCIEDEKIMDDRGIMPRSGALNDPRMGTMDKIIKCYTCKGGQAECPGHFGHIELAKPVYHIGFIEYVRRVLRCVCFNCSKLLAPRDKNIIDEINKIRYQKTRFQRVFKVADIVGTCDQESGGCGAKQPKYSKKGLTLLVEHNEEMHDQGRDRKQPLFPEQALKILEKITNEDCITMGFSPQLSRPEWMIIKYLPVAPPPVRPSVQMTNTLRQEDDLTYSYLYILRFNNEMKKFMEGSANESIINQLRECLQYSVATLMDNEIQGIPCQRHKNLKPLKAIRARLKGKEGRLRGNLMGKRVDFSARTVITPDPNLQLDQLGVPRAIAENLTIPETVTSQNIQEMRELVRRGPNEWPGAKYIIRHDDRQIDLSALKNRSDAHLECGYRVERHLKDGDYVLFNRQPSLHKMSIMGHRVKVLPYSTFRLNLSVTTPYNADFDGDEMNMHVPQSYETKAEIKEIMAVPKQIVSPQANKPVMGIVQDSLLGIMLLTERETFIEYDVVMNLLMWVTNFNGIVPQPAIYKPKPLWTGKQIISMIFPNVNLQRFGEGGETQFLKTTSEKDDTIIISKGELICGVLSKATVGSAPGGLIHIIWKDHGPDTCRDFVSQVQTLVNNWLLYHGFTIGVQDIIASNATVTQIDKILEKSKAKVKKIVLRAQLGKLKTQPGKNMLESFEAAMNNTLNSTRDEAGKLAFKNLDSKNKLKNMVKAGSKGAEVNISQIMACVGQQNVEGKRIPFGFNKRTLPHFSKDDYGPESKGFVENSYLKGLTPSEFYFHAMGGREGVIDTAVKTSETGYIQRRLIKALEDVMVKYDGTVRNSHQHIVQFLYGEDGMAGEYIEDLTIELLKINDDSLQKECSFIPLDPKYSRNKLEDDLKKSMDVLNVRELINSAEQLMELENEFKRIKEDRKILRYDILKNCDDKIHLPVNIPRLLVKAKQDFNIRPKSITDLRPQYVLGEMNKLMYELSVVPGHQKFPSPLSTEANNNSTMLFKTYLRYKLCTKQIIQVNRLSVKAFDWMIGEIKSIFEKSAAQPGEMIGSIAAQSIGEPATQMTLNTFHLAGVSAKNVTLGVPRLKEVINIAKTIKTPSMTIYLKKKYKANQVEVQKITSDIEHTTLQHLVKSSAIYYDPDPKTTVVKEDQYLVDLYNEVSVPMDEGITSLNKTNPWVLRFELDHEKVQSKSITMEQIEQKITQYFGDDIMVMHSDDNMPQLILRLRFRTLVDDTEQSADQFIKEMEDALLNEVALKGIHQVSRVYAAVTREHEFNEETGAYDHKEGVPVLDAQGQPMLDKEGKPVIDKYWLLETDGVALAKILTLPKIDRRRTFSNDILEILRVLGIEAVRMALINELRKVLNFYGIYVNYRHVSTLCDIMTHRGILTSITRHGINRTETGPLRKCSFEETVEILMEAAVYAETDYLTGITENIIMGQLAPFGTGYFDLVMDAKQLQEHVQEDYDMEADGGGTPVNYNDDIMDDKGRFTPVADRTPDYNPSNTIYGGGSVYDTGIGFSPSYNNTIQSPNYMQNSPSYQQTNTGASPIYVYQYQSPIYNPIEYQPGNSAQNQNSPIYSPTNPIQSSQSPGYSPSYNMSGHNIQSPRYGSNQQQQPNYSPTEGGAGYSSYSPAYSPNVGYRDASPNYSPTTPNMSSPSYQGGINQQRMYGAVQQQQQQRYSVDSSNSGGSSGGAMGSGGNQYSPAYNPSSVWMPNSPAYNPSSPCYDPTSYSGQGPRNNNNSACSPIKEEENSDKEEEKKQQ